MCLDNDFLNTVFIFCGILFKSISDKISSQAMVCPFFSWKKLQQEPKCSKVIFKPVGTYFYQILVAGHLKT